MVWVYEPSTFLQEPAEASGEDYSLDTSLSVPLNLIPTAKASLSNDNTMVTFQPSLSGMTCAHLDGKCGRSLWTASMQGFLASH